MELDTFYQHRVEKLLEVIEIIRKIEQGRTEPYLCIGSDDNRYIVKGNSALGKGRIVEYICAHIGKAFELPIPDCNIIDVPDYLLDRGTESIGAGLAFASLYIPQLQEVSLSMLGKIDKSLKQDVFLFDYWIRNEDRTMGDNGAGNPNLIFRPIDDQLFVLDHNLAFDEDYQFADTKSLHVFRDSWFDEQPDLLKIDEYKARMEAALADFDEVIAELPDEWFSCATVKDDLIDSIKLQLNSFNKPEFWNPLQ